MPVISAVVDRFRLMVESLQDYTLFTFETLRAGFRRPFYAREMFHQLHFALIGSLAIVLVSALVAGQALAIQLARELTNTGTKGELGHMMVISVVRALGPVSGRSRARRRES